MVEDRVIAEHLTALLTPTITSQSRCLGARSLARETRAGVDRLTRVGFLQLRGIRKSQIAEMIKGERKQTTKRDGLALE